MKKIVIALICFVLLISSAFATNEGTIVYVTDTGAKYHNSGCRYLKSINTVTLEQAVTNGYTPCSVCNPPIPDFAYTVKTPQKETKSSGGSYIRSSGSGSTYSRSLPTPSPTPKETKASIWDSGWSEWIGYGVAIVLIYVIPISAIAIKDAIKEKKENKAFMKERDAKKREYEAKYSGVSSLQAAGAPSDTAVDENGLPYRIDRVFGWGIDYTMFVSKSRKTYHKKYGCSGAKNQMNSYIILQSDMQPCGRCHPVLPDMKWVDEYKRIEEIKERFQIS